MKRKIKVLLIICLMVVIKVNATNGPIKQNSIIECSGKYYGSHGNPSHYHEVKKQNNEWVIASKESVIPDCKKKENIKEEVTLVHCIDGDTAKFQIKDEEKTVRFLAINAPELEHLDQGIKEEPFGKEASDYVCKMLTDAKKIYLEYDNNSDKEDKYGRMLAFVYADNNLIQEKVIEKGLAKVAYLYDNYRHVDELKEKERIAKEQKIGIWSEEQNKQVEDKKESNKLEYIFDKIIDFLGKLIEKIFALF